MRMENPAPPTGIRILFDRYLPSFEPIENGPVLPFDPVIISRLWVDAKFVTIRSMKSIRFFICHFTTRT